MNKKYATLIINQITTLIVDVEENHQENEQWFLDFLDELNKLSVSH